MIAEDQSAAVAFLTSPATHGGVTPVETIETHISRIFLVGDRAYKMKQAVKFPYADFSTASLRLAACEKELALNTRTAPALYLGVRRITRGDDGRLEFDGAGDAVDAVVEMKRFDQKCLFDQLAAAGGLTAELTTDLARMIASFHRTAPVVHDGGGAANIASVLDINEAGLAAASHIFPRWRIARFNAAFRDALYRHSRLLDRRESEGKVRRCHGDLHLRNICLLDGEPRLFDCIEFNDRIATVDTLYDLAFVLMDLWHRNLPELANLLMNRYLDASDDDDGFVLLPFFMAVRASVRAHVTCAQIETGGGERSARLTAEARSYFDLALFLLEDQSIEFVAIGGLSGSGKSTVAEALAAYVGAPPGARVVESDRIRKAMHGVAAETRLPAKAYRAEVSEKVYREMAWRARLILADGGSVVVDAVFDAPQNRKLIEQVALDLGLRFRGIWLDASPSLLLHRVIERTSGVSDADVGVLEGQIERGAGAIAWRHLDARKPVADLVSAINEPTRMTPAASPALMRVPAW